MIRRLGGESYEVFPPEHLGGGLPPDRAGQDHSLSHLHCELLSFLSLYDRGC